MPVFPRHLFRFIRIQTDRESLRRIADSLSLIAEFCSIYAKNEFGVDLGVPIPRRRDPSKSKGHQPAVEHMSQARHAELSQDEHLKRLMEMGGSGEFDTSSNDPLDGDEDTW